MAASVPNKFVGTTTQDVSSLDANFDALVNFLNSGVDFQGAELVSSYAAIRALTASTTSTTLAFTTGRLSMGDGGMGWFRADPSDTTSADNDGTVLVATDGTRWKRLFTGALNVLWFGMPTDGTDISSYWITVRDVAAKLYDIYFPGAHYKTTLPLDTKGLGHNDIYGDGPASWIENIATTITGGATNLFTGQAIYRGATPNFVNVFALSAVGASDSVLTFTTASDAANMKAGALYYFSSNDDIDNTPGGPLPTVATLVKVVSVDTVAGTVEIEHAIGFDVASPIISDTNFSTDATRQEELMDELSIHDLRLTCPMTDTLYGHPLNIYGAYKCNFYDLYLEGVVYSVNGSVKCSVHDIIARTNIYACVELAFCCQDTNVHHLKIDVLSIMPQSLSSNLILHAEQGLDNEISNITISAPGLSAGGNVVIASDGRVNIHDIEVLVGGMSSVVHVTSGPVVAPDSTRKIKIKNIYCRVLSGVINGVLMDPLSGNYAKNVAVEDCEVEGPCTNAIQLTGALTDVHLKGISAPAGIYIRQPTFSNVSYTKCVTTGAYSANSTSFPSQNIATAVSSNNVRYLCTTPPVIARNGSVITTTANAPYQTRVFKGGEYIHQDDSLVVRCNGEVNGTTGVKTVVLSLFGTLFTLISAPATANGVPITVEFIGAFLGTPVSVISGVIHTTVGGVATDKIGRAHV